ncbi:MAG TPA: ABC transporter ATP-binding protein [Candidatus Thermoplasmatota archaeon]|nr:ABC transporter ATP-binding protein [Candidatus Thermoplasmatota archaeon]
MNVLACERLSRWYGDVIAVNDLTVEVEPGITGVLGPNGAGKTSLLRMATGLVRPSAGTIRVLGEDPWDNPALAARVGYVPEGDAPWRDLSGLQCATLAARLSGLAPGRAEEAAREKLARVGLSSAMDRRVEAYSRGMRQKLKFALALAHDPELLILDEPLLGTDPPTRRDLVQLIKGLAAEGKSVLVSTHVLPDVEAMTQRILLVNHGRLMAYGEVAKIRDLLERYPRTVRLATPSPRPVGAALWGWESVLSVAAEEGAVVVRTRDPQRFYEDLQRMLLERQDLAVMSVTSPDETIEAVFRYLVEA